MEKKESADAQKHNLDFVCIKYDFIPHPIHKTNQIYQTIKQSNFDSFCTLSYTMPYLFILSRKKWSVKTRFALTEI